MFENISVKTALQMAYEGKAVIYDIRSEEAYKRGHLPMAQNMPEERLWTVVNTEQKVVLYCDYGNQSMRAAKKLSEAGYPNLASIVGGYHAYEGYVEARKNELWTLEWKERGIGSTDKIH